jgi:hypothetical protein
MTLLGDPDMAIIAKALRQKHGLDTKNALAEIDMICAGLEKARQGENHLNVFQNRHLLILRTFVMPVSNSFHRDLLFATYYAGEQAT